MLDQPSYCLAEARSFLSEGRSKGEPLYYLSRTSPLGCDVTYVTFQKVKEMVPVWGSCEPDLDCSMPPRLQNLKSCSYDLPGPMLNNGTGEEPL